MAITEVTRIHAEKPEENHIEDPVIIKVAKLALILADREIGSEDKLLCVKAAERFGYISEVEAKQLLLYRTDLERFGKL